jgi:glycine/D-amino acid oxidase-like deaminating enzyme/nitrite reductase/ring-hydroxylating ferredoxin subunit
MAEHQKQFAYTSGLTDSVWIHEDPYSNRPRFPALKEDAETDVCIVGSGIAGISAAYELVARGHKVILIEAREVLSGETGRTSGHLATALDEHYVEIKGKHGDEGAKMAAQSHNWAVQRVGEVAKELGIECEYRLLPGYEISQFEKGTKDHDKDMKALQEEAEYAKQLGLQAEFVPNLTIKGWAGKHDQRGGAKFSNQAAFHPTQYLLGIVKWLQQQPKFKLFTNTRMMSSDESGGLLGLGEKHVTVKTEGGQSIKCNHLIQATCVPLQKLSLIVEMEMDRTYCVAMRIPKDSVEDCLIYDSAEKYKYIRLTRCDDKDDYLIIGGCDHKVGQEEPEGRFEELEAWVRERFPQAGKVDYRWSGQVFEPFDYMAFIGKKAGTDRTYVVTGDSGNGLTHGVLASKLLADEIEGKENPWATLYSPKRVASLAKSATEMVGHDLQVNSQYKRLLQTDIHDIEDLVPGSGGVLNKGLAGPVAVYKSEDGEVHKMSALCPHLKGVVCWNPAEKSWDCPVHGSRFSDRGVCIMGPSKANLAPAT